MTLPTLPWIQFLPSMSRLMPGLALLAVACASVPPAVPPAPAAEQAPTIPVPDLRGLSLPQARERLNAAGLLPGSAEVTSAPAGMVWHQSLPAGSLVAPGTPVDLEVVEQAGNPLGCPAPEPAAQCSATPAHPARMKTWHHRAQAGPPHTPANQLDP